MNKELKELMLKFDFADKILKYVSIIFATIIIPIASVHPEMVKFLQAF